MQIGQSLPNLMGLFVLSAFVIRILFVKIRLCKRSTFQEKLNFRGKRKMKNYHAEVLDVSLKQKKMLKEYTVLEVKKRFCGLLKIYIISIPENIIEETVQKFQKNMGTALHKEWYITFHTDTQAIILFRNRIFKLNTTGIVPIPYKLLSTFNAKDKKIGMK